MEKEINLYYVYILTNKNHTVLYIGVTNSLKKRINQHKSKNSKSFAKKYNTDKLIYFEKFQFVNDAIKREKQIKKWNREWKVNLINDFNPDWNDLFKIFDLT